MRCLPLLQHGLDVLRQVRSEERALAEMAEVRELADTMLAYALRVPTDRIGTDTVDDSR